MKVRHVFFGAVIVAGAVLGASCTTDGDDATVDAGPGQVTSDDNSADETPRDPTDPDDTTAGSTVDPYVVAMADALREQRADSDRTSLTDDQIACLAHRVVAAFGTDRLEAEGITPDGLEVTGYGFLGIVVDEDVANEVYDSYDACGIDIVSVFIDNVASLGPRAQMVPCLTDVITDDLLRAWVVEMMSSAEEDLEHDDVGRAVATCDAAAS